MKSRLDILEGTIKSLFEGNSSLFPWIDEQSMLIQKLLESIHSCLVELEGEVDVLPNYFIIYLNPDDRTFIEKQPDWRTAVTKFITELSADLGFHQEQKPEIELVIRHSLSRGEVQVKTKVGSVTNEQTEAVPINVNFHAESKELPSCKASLLLEDEQFFNLDKSVINIGRKSTNHLIIDDFRVSRTHAQIRNVSDGFIIFDIGSSGGTYVNGERINQRKLSPGDVISLAGVKLIYTEEQPAAIEHQRQITSEIKTTSSQADSSC
jgi:hypothetical protein